MCLCDVQRILSQVGQYKKKQDSEKRDSDDDGDDVGENLPLTSFCDTGHYLQKHLSNALTSTCQMLQFELHLDNLISKIKK